MLLECTSLKKKLYLISKVDRISNPPLNLPTKMGFVIYQAENILRKGANTHYHHIFFPHDDFNILLTKYWITLPKV